jgi:RimJ/RimL family protein N-acetyltransferase
MSIEPNQGEAMLATDSLATERLILRRWTPEDVAPMAGINRDPEVAEFLNRPADEDAIAGFVDFVLEHWRVHGFGPWAVQLRGPRDDGSFLGFAGLAHVPPFLAAAGTAPELGWRFSRSSWGRGYATEAARAARDDAFGRLGLTQIISVIHPENVRSQRVATKLGMHLDRQIENPVLGRMVDVWGLRADEVA